MTEPASPQPTVEVEVADLDQFVRLISAWHASQTSRAKMLLGIPEGTTFEVDGQDIVLTGDTIKGFKLGVEMVLMCLGTLPFVTQTDEAPEGDTNDVGEASSITH